MMYDGLTDAFSGQVGLTAENVAEKYHVTEKSKINFLYIHN